MTRWPGWLLELVAVNCERAGDLLSRGLLRTAAKANAEYWRRRLSE